MGRRVDNCHTMVALEIAAPAWSVCEAVVARATLALAHLPDHGAVPGFRLFWQRRVGEGSATDRTELAFATLPEDGHLVLGRHGACDVRLTHPSVALRHVLLRARRDAAGALSLLGTDLGAALPMLVGPSGEPARAFGAAGPTVLRLADEILVALPVGAAPGSVPDESALRAVVDADPDQARSIPRGLEELAVRTMVSSMSRTRIRPFAAPLPVEVVSREAGAAFARVAMRGPQGRVVIELSRAQLERVVLVGRYPRCRRGELSPFSANVSRVHAGLVLEGDDLFVVDLASTNRIGTPGAAGAHPRAVRVRTRGSVSLGPSDRLDIELASP